MAALTLCARINGGVGLLCGGLAAGALIRFREGLTTLASDPASGADLLLAPARRGERLSPVDISSTPTETAHDTFFSMYKKAFRVSEREDDHAILSVVLVYNVAVTYHVLGSSYGTASDLKKARQLYTRVYSALTEDLQDNLGEKAILLLATCNNLGHVHSLLMNNREALFSFRHLEGTTALVEDSGIASVHLEFFIMAVVLGRAHEDGQPFTSPAA
mmetsp:Transcript_20019/g.41833  ORF Transcript_20019/g.41833 Transcript_20019/m.41833 type:complete len:217 (-) Transcript_20019:707-1357(-)|eukprot:CAMPEP_0172472102 /NCGR_PEP_ID=MMETSP1065-20121228/68151_1 /TAXON_ID=265537 /ORGANISM="Amphiprora paludosa, Strain CCMP125" /LENGTH=216 /DNA_ID=CAMNT_0013230223 /DNA_START=3421 /DNA_END=4071 /DNA_ORIENTATION=+